MRREFVPACAVLVALGAAVLQSPSAAPMLPSVAATTRAGAATRSDREQFAEASKLSQAKLLHSKVEHITVCDENGVKAEYPVNVEYWEGQGVVGVLANPEDQKPAREEERMVVLLVAFYAAGPHEGKLLAKPWLLASREMGSAPWPEYVEKETCRQRAAKELSKIGYTLAGTTFRAGRLDLRPIDNGREPAVTDHWILKNPHGGLPAQFHYTTHLASVVWVSTSAADRFSHTCVIDYEYSSESGDEFEHLRELAMKLEREEFQREQK